MAKKKAKKKKKASKGNKLPRVDSFDLSPGRILAGKYEVLSRLGKGWEGEVYLINEIATGIERAAKMFFPRRNKKGKTSQFHAKKLHKLRHCPIVIQYATQDTFQFRGHRVPILVSEFVEGEILSAFLERQPGKRLVPFQAVHLLHSLASGIESIHRMGEYHGDLHTDNIIVQRYGLGFELKLVDFFHWGGPLVENIREDVVDLVKIFHESLGGKKPYKHHPPEVKGICSGLRRNLILKKFKTAGQLRAYLEYMVWS